MVRREEDARSSAADERASPSCASPAGESPVPVSAEAPGSRPQAPGESPVSRAGHRKPADGNVPPGRKRVRGPQHEVKPGASTEKQSGSRAAHVTAKATSRAPVSERARDLGGVWGAARVQGEARNTRGPSGQPQSRQGVSYKPRAKASAAQRESEGVVVVSMVAQNNATGAKGPCGDGVDEAGKREGMAATSGPNHPDRRNPVDKVRRLQRRLWIAAKRSPGRRFHALYDHVWRNDILQAAWTRVKRNKGAAGVDSMTIAAIEQGGVGVLSLTVFDRSPLTHDRDAGRRLSRIGRPVEAVEGEPGKRNAPGRRSADRGRRVVAWR